MRGRIVAGKYRLSVLLGSGGMAEVWSATNTFTERHVAIKFLNPRVARTAEAAARFLKEAKVSARIDHPTIVDVLDVGQTEKGQLFLVMELLSGFSLDVALRRRRPTLSAHELASVMLEIASALAAAHDAGIVHRDLKPSNIFLHCVRPKNAALGSETVVPKLLDFGVSKFLEDDQNHALTMAGTVLGSPLYMSPEQARGEPNLDGRSDVFAFGAILFEALCGYRAHDSAQSFNALIVAIATKPPKSIDLCAPHLPASLRRVVRACMEVDRSRRAQTFDDVIAMLRQAMPELEGSGLRLPPAPSDEPVIHVAGPSALSIVPAERHPSRRAPPPPPDSSGFADAAELGPRPSPRPPKRRPSGRGAALAVLLTGGIGAAVLAGTSRAPGAPLASLLAAARGAVASARAHSAPTAPAVVVTKPVAEIASEPPTVSVDALPSPGKRTPPRGAGRLQLAASPGACAITIDGKERGATPLAAIELSSGEHQVSCRTASGKVRTASVNVHEGAVSKYRFALDE